MYPFLHTLFPFCTRYTRPSPGISVLFDCALSGVILCVTTKFDILCVNMEVLKAGIERMPFGDKILIATTKKGYIHELYEIPLSYLANTIVIPGDGMPPTNLYRVVMSLTEMHMENKSMSHYDAYRFAWLRWTKRHGSEYMSTDNEPAQSTCNLMIGFAVDPRLP